MSAANLDEDVPQDDCSEFCPFLPTTDSYLVEYQRLIGLGEANSERGCAKSQ